ncbi:hypothetical protein MRB53_030594 [Persea americana]|uniref:Uncharacterized protein n=1 Tax=Persea americana TaxID=3435 RepID=A0ACC2KLP7_PERAE|nr:hypothetical protein MRB53_030594 [Persea americana]
MVKLFNHIHEEGYTQTPSIPCDLSSSLRRSHQHRISSLNRTSSIPALILFICAGPKTSHPSSSPSLSAITVPEPTTHHHLFHLRALIVQSLRHLIATFSIASPGTGNLITISSLDYPIPLTPTIAAMTSVTSLRRSPLATLTLLLRLHPRSAYPHPHPSSSSPSPSPHRPFPSSSRPRLLHHYPVQIHHPTRLIIHLSHHSISPSCRYLSKPSNTSYTRGEN